jgi:hypothetical protein
MGEMLESVSGDDLFVVRGLDFHLIQMVTTPLELAWAPWPLHGGGPKELQRAGATPASMP